MDLYHDTTTFVDTDSSGSSFERMPDGKYKCMITQVEEKIAQTSGVAYCSFTIEIIDGPHKGRKTWDSLYLNSSNPNAVSIAKRKLNEIAIAIGKSVIQGADCFKYKEIGVYLIKDKDKADKNQVKHYLAARNVTTETNNNYKSNGNMGSTTTNPVRDDREDEIPF